MYYRIKVYDDGDIYVNKTEKESFFDVCLYVRTIEELKRELISYGVINVQECIITIKHATTYEEVKCF
ncbi:MAG: hypothetical protein JW861_08545 [Bacteroidales bacterium]|nr:hypothetical protein [Bacteroidales bacterium]